MATTTSLKEKQFECSRCGSVTFRQRVLHHETEGIQAEDVVDETVSRGACLAGKEGARTHHSLLEACPIYSEFGE